MRRLRPLLMLALFAPAAFAAPLAPPARMEIDGLLDSLTTSSCEFNRNGRWYTAAEAKAHLLTKLRYLEDRGMLHSAEQFIEMAASTSSMSGQPYLVRCGGAPPVASRAWLTAQLRNLRAGATGKGAP